MQSFETLLQSPCVTYYSSDTRQSWYTKLPKPNHEITELIHRAKGEHDEVLHLLLETECMYETYGLWCTILILSVQGTVGGFSS